MASRAQGTKGQSSMWQGREEVRTGAQAKGDVGHASGLDAHPPLSRHGGEQGQVGSCTLLSEVREQPKEMPHLQPLLWAVLATDSSGRTCQLTPGAAARARESPHAFPAPQHDE